MRACSFDRLLQFINERLDLDGQVEVYDHLDRCAICRDAVYQLLSERGTHAPSGSASARQQDLRMRRIIANAVGYSSGSSPVMLKDMCAHWCFRGLALDARRRR